VARALEEFGGLKFESRSKKKFQGAVALRMVVMKRMI
jgi:hypothetical protein